MKYLASPYAADEPEVMQRRFEMAAEVTADLLKQGVVIFSPIVHCHYLAVNFDLPRTHDFWLRYDLSILARCEELIVLTIPGWLESKGVREEINFAVANGISITSMQVPHG